jgi:hypothetical protein
MAFIAFWFTHFLPLNPRNLLHAPSTTPYKIPLKSDHLFTNLYQNIHKGGVEIDTDLRNAFRTTTIPPRLTHLFPKSSTSWIVSRGASRSTPFEFG